MDVFWEAQGKLGGNAPRVECKSPNALLSMVNTNELCQPVDGKLAGDICRTSRQGHQRCCRGEEDDSAASAIL